MRTVWMLALLAACAGEGATDDPVPPGGGVLPDEGEGCLRLEPERIELVDGIVDDVLTVVNRCAHPTDIGDLVLDDPDGAFALDGEVPEALEAETEVDVTVRLVAEDRLAHEAQAVLRVRDGADLLQAVDATQLYGVP